MDFFFGFGSVFCWAVFLGQGNVFVLVLLFSTSITAITLMSTIFARNITVEVHVCSGENGVKVTRWLNLYMGTTHLNL